MKMNASMRFVLFMLSVHVMAAIITFSTDITVLVKLLFLLLIGANLLFYLARDVQDLPGFVV